MNPLRSLIELFRRFPGIGERQATRFAYHLLNEDPLVREQLAALIRSLPNDVRQCSLCQRFTHDAPTGLCPICRDTGRTSETLMVVAHDTDVEAFERAGSFAGRYFVLGGLVPLIERGGGTPLRFAELIERVTQEKESGLKEIILGLNATREGDFTADYLAEQLAPVLTDSEIRMSTLGRGLSTGLEIEYSDRDTVAHALRNRAQR